MKRFRSLMLCVAIVAVGALTVPAAQQRVNPNSNTERGGADVKQVPGRKIGNITTRGNIIHLELDANVVAANLFDLDKRTLRFTPGAGGFRVENMALQWDAETGTLLQGNEVRCSQGRLQVTWYQPVWIGAVQAQEQHPDGRFPGYNMAVAQIGHELAHRWSTRTRAIVNGETIELRANHDSWGMSGATHWPASVSTPVPFPFSRPVEASIMGGANWKDNGDGTFTQLASGTMNPASGFSYLELYLMGFLPASKVPDFFALKNQKPAGRSPEGQTIVAAEKVRITIQDVIAHNGPRVPSFENSPNALNTAMVAVTLKGRQPSAAMLKQLEGIGAAWAGYWSKVTGGVSTMSLDPGRK